MKNKYTSVIECCGWPQPQLQPPLKWKMTIKGLFTSGVVVLYFSSVISPWKRHDECSPCNHNQPLPHQQLRRNNPYIGSLEVGLQSSNKEPMYGLVRPNPYQPHCFAWLTGLRVVGHAHVALLMSFKAEVGKKVEKATTVHYNAKPTRILITSTWFDIEPQDLNEWLQLRRPTAPLATTTMIHTRQLWMGKIIVTLWLKFYPQPPL